MTRKRWEILAASAVGVSALALAIAHPFQSPSGGPPLELPPAPPSMAAPAPEAQLPEVQPPEAVQRPRIEVVFALDTTGSMGGLLEGAKQKIWSVANQLASGQPRPEIRVGLVAYRDLWDAYVTQSTPLTEDLDAVYGTLLQYRADGGGDGPEHVNAALAQAIRQTQWSQEEGVLRLVFLVGDAPPHDDYEDGMTAAGLADEAAAKGIVINTIRCGSDPQTEAAWKDIAHRAGGRYASIAQDGGVVATVTPFDAELSRLNAELADTVMGYGSVELQAASRDKMMRRKAMSAPAAAAAASFAAKSGKLNREDLVTAVEEGAASLDEVAEEELPEALKGLSLPKKKAVLAETKRKRERVNQQILELSKQRDAYLREAEPAKPDAFDAQVLDMVRTQTAEIGVAY